MTYQQAIAHQQANHAQYANGLLGESEQREYDDAKAFTDLVEYDYRAGLIKSLEEYDD